MEKAKRILGMLLALMCVVVLLHVETLEQKKSHSMI